MLQYQDIHNSFKQAVNFFNDKSINLVVTEVSLTKALIAVMALMFVMSLLFKLKKRQPWRIGVSKKWLTQFRKSKSKYTPLQRFAFIRGVDHFLWEEILMSCFEERGYQITRTKMTRDGGSDGYVKINKEMIVIQAKRYKGSISRSHVLALCNLVQGNKRLSKGLFIHTGKTSKPILEYFRMNSHLELISGVDTILAFLDGEVINVFGQQLNESKCFAKRTGTSNA